MDSIQGSDNGTGVNSTEDKNESQTIPQWQKDPRVAYSQVTGKWILEDDVTGAEYEYNEDLGQWMPVIDEQEAELQQQAYSKEEAKEDGGEERNGSNKRKSLDHTSQEQRPSNLDKKRKTSTKDKDPHSSLSTPPPVRSIYISNLPEDTTFNELEETFSRYGMIADDIRTGQKKIKLYTGEDGKFKGDALVTFFKPESVSLSIEMADDSELRPEKPSGNRIKVEKAKFSSTESSESRTQLTAQEKLRLQKRFQKQNEKLADWDDDDIVKPISKRWEKVVILKNVFDIKELEKDEMAAYEIKQDIILGCEEIGPVSNVTIFDLEPEGVVSVKFESSEDALDCIERMDNRFFDGKRLKAMAYDGSVRYKKKSKANEAGDEEERLKNFGNWLEAQGEDGQEADVEKEDHKNGGVNDSE